METKEQVQGEENAQLEQDDFGSAFAEDEEAAAPEATDDATPPETEVEPEPVKEPEPKEETKAEPFPAQTTEEVDWRKRAEDNQAAFTKGQQELKAIRDELAALKKKAEVVPEKKEEPQAAPELPAHVKEVFETYPEFKPVIEFIAEQQVKQAFGGVDLKQLVAEREQIQQQLGAMVWERDVANGFMDESGTFIEGHPDLHKITAPANKDYWDWYNTRFDVASRGCDPKEAIRRIGEYKESVLKKAAAEHDAKVKTEAEKVQEVMAGTLQSRPSPKAPEKKDSGSFSDGFKDD